MALQRAHRSQPCIALFAAAFALVSLACALPGAAAVEDVATHETGMGDVLAGVASSDCQLRIEGRGIERLALAAASGEVINLSQPGEFVSLAAGTYWVREVELTGGFRCYSWLADDDNTVQVAAGKTAVLRVGPPLTSQVRVRRAGRLLNLDYELVDAAGRNYVRRGSESAAPPKFTVFKDGRPLGSGSFEYG